METNDVTEHEQELKVSACKLSLVELNDLVNDCLDAKNFEDAQIYAKIYTRRVKR